MHLPESLGEHDAAAVASHHRINAINTHGTLADRVWIALRHLGVEEGRMLVHGIDAPAFTGAPRGYTRSRVQDDTALVAQIPPVADGEHERVVARPYTAKDGAGFDVVIANLPYSDVRFTRAANRTWILNQHEKLVQASLAATLPGGIAAVIATGRVMDTESVVARGQMLEDADLIGAVRLPSGSLREMDFTDHTDQVVDLLLFRRRPSDQTEVRSADFETTAPDDLSGETVVVNRYWIDHPDHVIGRPAPYIAESGRTQMWVMSEGEPLYDRLASVVGRIIDSAETRGLRAASASWRTHQRATVSEGQHPDDARGSRPGRLQGPDASSQKPPRRTIDPGPGVGL